MRKVTMPVPALKEVIGDQADNYPQGFMWPWPVLIREVHVRYPTSEPVEVTMPGYGVVTKQGREYSIVFDANYARAKDYPVEISGVWG